MGKIIVDEIRVSKLEKDRRTIRICLPENYDRDIQNRYPVLYMHDGQHMVDPSPESGYSWNVEPTLKKMQDDGEIDGIIVVGIDTNDANRIPEYSHAIDKKAEKIVKKMFKGSLFLPSAHLYGKFLVETLKPHIDKNYRTLPDREHTGTFGSSYGGNVSLFLGTVYNDVFGIVGAFSPAYWLLKNDLFKRIEAKIFLPETKIYHDMGSRETVFSRFTRVMQSHQLHRVMKKKGFDKTHLRMVIDPSGQHNELFWQERFPGFVRFAFPKSKE